MTVLQITPSYKPAEIYGGPVFSIAALSESFIQNGEEVTVYTTTANGLRELDVSKGTPLKIGGVSVYYFSRWTKDHSHFSPALLITLWKTCRRFDCIHIHSWWNLVSIFSIIICLSKGITPIVSPRGMLSNYTLGTSKAKRVFQKRIGIGLLRKVRFHATTDAEAAEIRELLPKARIDVIFNFVNLTPVSLTPEYSKVLKMLFLSRIDPKKGLDILLEALAETTFPFHLTIAGGGDNRYINSLKRLAAQLNLTKQLSWAGTVSSNSKSRIFGKNDLFILPSFNENFANVVIESLSAGTPVLISDRVGLAEFVRKHHLGWSCSPKACDLKTALQHAYFDIIQREQIRQRAPQIIRQEFSKEILIAKYMDMYKECINDQTNSQPAVASRI